MVTCSSEEKMLKYDTEYSNISGHKFNLVCRISKTRKVKVKFIETGTEVWCYEANAEAGKVKDHNAISVAGVGSMGTKDFTKNERTLWKNMLYRVKEHPAYKDISVCDRWLILSNFIEDIKKIEGYNLWLETPHQYQLDKDMKCNGVKIYSPQTCIFISVKQNLQLINRDLGKSYVAKHKDGTVVEFVNQRHFSNQYGLDYRNVSRAILNGGTVRGWRITEQE